MEQNEQDLKNEQKPNPKKKRHFPWKYFLNITLVLLITAIAILITVFSDFNNIVTTFSNVDWRYIGICLGMELFFVLCFSFILFCFARLYTRHYHFHQALACDSIGRFWCGVTPGATGGQFMQAYTYKKQGVPISSAASIMIMYSICYQVVLILYGIVSLIAKGNTLTNIGVIDINGVKLPIIPFVVIGFILNLGFIAILFLMSYSTKFHHFMLGPCISFFAKIRLLKNPDQKREDLRIQVENFKIELKRLLSNIPFLLLIMVLFFISMTSYFGVPFFAAKALGADMEGLNNFDGFMTCVYYSNFHQMITGLIPIPGSAGVSEYFFYTLFKDFFAIEGGANACAAGQLIWRTITFTLPLLVGGFVSAFYKSSPAEEAQDKTIGRSTFVEITRATISERALTAKAQFQTSSLSKSAVLAKLVGDEEEQKKIKEKRVKKKDKKVDKRDEIEPIIENKEKTSISENIKNAEWEEINIIEDDEK